MFDCRFNTPYSNWQLLQYSWIRAANSHLLHSKWVSLFVVQVFLQVEEGIEEYVGHPAALQITEGYLTWRKRHIHRHMHKSQIQIERQVWTFQWKEITENTKGELALTLTLVLRFDQVEHLAEQILEGQRFDAHSFHPLTLFLIEILQLKHGQDTIAIRVHAAEPVLYTGERNGKIEHVTAGWYATIRHTQRERNGETAAQSLYITWWDFSCLLRKWGTRRTQRSSSCLLSAQRYPWIQERQCYSHSLLMVK